MIPMVAIVVVVVVVVVVPQVVRSAVQHVPRAVDGALSAQAVQLDDRLARMEEAIQIMAQEIERLRAAREREEHYLSASADSPRALPDSASDSKTA